MFRLRDASVGGQGLADGLDYGDRARILERAYDDELWSADRDFSLPGSADRRDPFPSFSDYRGVVCRKPGRLAPIFALVVASAPLVRTAHAQPGAWPDDPIPPAPAKVEQPPPPPRSTRDVLREDSDIGARYRAARGMMVGGGVSMGVGLGVAATAGLVVFFADPWAREDWEGEPVDYEAARGDRVTVVSLLVVASLATIGGATLLGIGAHRRQRVVEEARRVSLGFGRGGLALRF